MDTKCLRIRIYSFTFTSFYIGLYTALLFPVLRMWTFLRSMAGIDNLVP